MLKSDELKLTIKDKRVEVENFQREGKITEAKNAAAELTKLVDEYDVAIAMERSERDQMLKNSSPAHAPTNENSATLRNRAFNKLLLGRGRLTDEEKQAYFNVSGSPGQPGQIESIDEKGGYLVPEEHIAQIREFRKAYASLKNYCHVMTTTTTKGKYPTLGEENGLLINFTEATDIKGKEIVVLPNGTMPNNTSGQTTTTPFFVGNLKDYLLFVERQGVEIAVSTEYLFAKYATALRCVVRFGATIDDGDAMKAYNVSIG